MASEQLTKLLSELLDATSHGAVGWEETAEEDAFRIGLGDGMIRIQSRTNPDNDERQYEAYLMNKQGRVVDEISSWGSNYKLLRELYEAARSSALNMELVVRSMLSDLREGRTRELPPDGKEAPPF